MGTVLSHQDRKMVVYNSDTAGLPQAAFNLNTYNYAEQLNNVKNKERNVTCNDKATLLATSGQTNNGNSGHKKHSILINVLNVGKHFSVNRKKEKEKNRKEKERQLAAQQLQLQLRTTDKPPTIQLNNAIDSNKNISKSMSCYNLKSGTTTDNIELVKNLSRDVAGINSPTISQMKLENAENQSRRALAAGAIIGKPIAPPLPPKPTILLCKNSIKPIDGHSYHNQTSTTQVIKNGITLTSASFGQQAIASSPSSSHRKTVIQVS